eukprot:TRINITY_DN58771_c0_g1_i1.p1 TRINITY_DN58771_c0_g1~~TRINITY_DN58771_c0_g1_i1.p1  ORF type:complete len:557 (+),score=96.08 TRINITY_DN58771_c0_g1_i1:66-1736(+)
MMSLRTALQGCVRPGLRRTFPQSRHVVFPQSFARAPLLGRGVVAVTSRQGDGTGSSATTEGSPALTGEQTSPNTSSSSSTAVARKAASERLMLSKDTMPAGISEDDLQLLESLQEAVTALGDDATDDHPIVEVCNKVAGAFRDKAALLKRNWTDEMFQEGEDLNEERVAQIETLLATSLSGAGLEDGENLGGALDIVGVYMKNYKLDKADAVLARCGPHVSARGGVWMVKWLNHVSTVRMKQGRYVEALEMLYDLELHSPYNAEEAPEFFETLNRNLAWALKSLGRIDDAVVYFERMARASVSHKGRLDWFDCWDVGKLAATHAYRDKNMPAFYRGRALVEEALRMQIEAEPEDLVMRAKVHDSLAECFFVAEDFRDAGKHYGAAYDLLLQTVGPNSPLFGKQARHSANFHIAQGGHAEALPFLGQALVVETAKDAVKVQEIMELVDLLVTTQQRASGASLETLESNHPALKALQKNLQKRGLDSSVSYGILCHKMSLLYLHESQRESKAVRRALRLAKASVKVLRSCMDGSRDASEWLRMAELHLQMLASVRKQQ